MKKFLVVFLLCLSFSPEVYGGRLKNCWEWMRTSRPAQMVSTIIYGQKDEGVDLIGKVTAGSPPPELPPPHGETTCKAVVRGGKNTLHVVHGIAQLALPACFAVAFAGWAGEYMQNDEEAGYWFGAVGMGLWAFIAASGNDEFLPASLVTDAADSRFPAKERIVHTTLRATGTGLSYFVIAYNLSLASAHKDEICLSSLPYREFMAFVFAGLMANQFGKAFAGELGSRHAHHSQHMLDFHRRGVGSIMASPTGHPLPGVCPQIGLEDLVHRSSRFSGRLAQVAVAYWLYYQYRAYIAEGRECEESGLGQPNALDDPDGFVEVLNKAFLKAGVGAGIGAFAVFPWLLEKGRSTGTMFFDYIRSAHPAALTTLGLSVVFAGITGGAVSDHFMEWGLKALGPLVTAEGAVGILVSQVSALAPYASAVLIPFVEQIQAATGVWAVPFVSSPTNPLEYLTDSSALATGLIKTGCVMGSVAFLTSPVQEGVEGWMFSILKTLDTSTNLKKWLQIRIGTRNAHRQMLIMEPSQLEKLTFEGLSPSGADAGTTVDNPLLTSVTLQELQSALNTGGEAGVRALVTRLSAPSSLL